MSCYKPKKSPYWHYDFQFEGVRFHGSTGCTARGAARRVEARKREQAAIGELTAARPPMTLDDAGERYFQEVAKDQASADLTDTMLDRLTRGLGPATLLSEIGDKIETYIARRRGQRARHKKTRVANATVNREIELLRRRGHDVVVYYAEGAENTAEATAIIDPTFCGAVAGLRPPNRETL